MAWLLAEDAALKARLQGIAVSDTKQTNRPVEVYFRFPQKEVRTTDYPFITIDLVDIQFDRLRAHGGYVHPALGYDIPGYTPDGNPGTVAKTYFPTPVNLFYQVVTYSRNPLHDRTLQGQLLTPPYLPLRFGFLNVDDGSTRRLELRSVDPADVRGTDGKTIYRKVYTVEVSSEMLAETVTEVLKANAVRIDLWNHFRPPVAPDPIVHPGWTQPAPAQLDEQPVYAVETITQP